MNEYNNHRDERGDSWDLETIRPDNRPFNRKRIGNALPAERNEMPLEASLLYKHLITLFPPHENNQHTR